MSQFKVFFIIALGLIAITSQVAADCNVCTKTTFAACVNKTAFAVCFDGVTPSTTIVSCPVGQICTDDQGICKVDDGTVTAGCSVTTPECNTCADIFACVSKTEFDFCDGAGNLMGYPTACPNGQYCSAQSFLDQETICVPSCLVEPTCSNTEAVTTPAPVPDWRKTCDGITTAGYYTNIQDKTCATYVYCEMYNNVMDSVLYTCTSGYFNQATKKCQATKPAGCT